MNYLCDGISICTNIERQFDCEHCKKNVIHEKTKFKTESINKGRKRNQIRKK